MARWVILLMIARVVRSATSVGKQVTRLLSARRRSLATIVVRRGISTKCTKPKKAAGKVFTLNAKEVEHPDNLIRGICFINNTPLIAIIDTGATHSFIAASCVERLGLVMTPLSRGMVIDTPTSGSVTTSFMCAKCPVSFGNVDFELDLVCLLLKHMDVIFGMDWMLTFGVNINCLTKSVTFSKPVVEEGGKFLTAEQVKKSLDGEASVFMMFASLKESSEKGVGDFAGSARVSRSFSGRHYQVTVGDVS